MLDYLPNELLVKIFERTDESTNRQCRLLNSRLNSVIERDVLHKKELCELVNRPGQRYIYIQCEESDEPTFYYPQMHNVNWTKIFKQYRPSGGLHLHLEKIHVTKYLADQLAQFECVKKVKWLEVNKCTFDDIECSDLVYLLDKIEVKSLWIDPGRDKEYIIPNDIFRCVSDRIRINPEGDVPVLRHFDDESLDTWFNPEKKLVIINFPTGFTVNGIKKQLQKLQNANPGVIANREWHFGIIFDDIIKFEEMLETFNEIRLSRRNVPWRGPAILYEISSLNGEDCHIAFRVVQNFQQ